VRTGRPTSAGAALAALALLLLAPGCWVPLERGKLMEDRLDKLEAEAAASKKGLDEQRELVKDRVAKVDQKIAEVQDKLDELNKVSRRSGADLGVSVQKVQEDLAKLNGELEVEQHRLGDLEKAIASLKMDTEGRFAALKGAGALDAYEARQRMASLPKPDDRTAVLELARKEESGGDKGVAVEMYEDFVRRWPDDPKAVDAGMRAGELLMGMRRWREALLAYGKVAQDFPKTPQAPLAMVGAGDAMLKLDMRDDAKATFASVMEKYPKTSASSKAKSRLSEINAAEKAEKKAAPKKK